MAINNDNISFEILATISLAHFYNYASKIMEDHRFSISSSLHEIYGRRRTEIWISKNNPDDKALVWIEVIGNDSEYDSYITPEVLRLMNEEGLTKLYFFINSYIDEDDKDLLSGPSNFIYAAEEIVESILSISKKAAGIGVRVRKAVTTPSGLALMKHFLSTAAADRDKVKVRIRTSNIPELIHKYSGYAKEILEKIDDNHSIDEISPEFKEWAKQKQYELLPELLKVARYTFMNRFSYLATELFTLIQLLIIYIGSIVDYELIEDVAKSRTKINGIISKLDSTDEDILKYKANLMAVAERSAYRLSMASVTITIVSIVILLVLVKL